MIVWSLLCNWDTQFGKLDHAGATPFRQRSTVTAACNWMLSAMSSQCRSCHLMCQTTVILSTVSNMLCTWFTFSHLSRNAEWICCLFPIMWDVVFSHQQSHLAVCLSSVLFTLLCKSTIVYSGNDLTDSKVHGSKHCSTMYFIICSSAIHSQVSINAIGWATLLTSYETVLHRPWQQNRWSS